MRGSLQLITGPAKSGKSTWITGKIDALSRRPDSRIILIVPEQFTFETEKNLFRSLGGEQFKHVNVTSFTRLATEVFRLYGGVAGQYANDCAKCVIMDMALEELRDSLEVYAKSARNRGFAQTMLEAVSELKNADVAAKDFLERSERLPDGPLKEKARETALIYAAYDTMLSRAYLDPLDDLSRAVRMLETRDFFAGSTVIFDEFKGFTAPEYAMMKLIFRQAEAVYLSLCLDLERANRQPAGLFSTVREAYNRAEQYARQLELRILAPVKLERTYFRSAALVHLEQNLFSPTMERWSDEGLCDVHAALCRNEYAEVDYALSTIAQLVRREGFRYDDIAIISRDLESYLPKLEAGFLKYGIPYFTDQLIPAAHKPLIRFVQNLLSCASRGLTGENVLALLKCGMTRFSVEEIAELENYVFVWNISGRQWEEPFTGNPRGFQESFTEEDTAALASVNELRAFLAERLVRFRQEVRDASARQFCAAILSFLEGVGVQEALERLIADLYAKHEQEAFELAQEYARVWELLMELLDTIASASDERPMKPARFEALFALAVSTCHMGSLPQALDTVIVGSADRIRTGEKRAIFVLGVNENVLPYTPADTGVFTDREREQLRELEIDLAKPVKDRIREERFIAYKTLTSPEERLYLTARKATISGEIKAPSILFSELRRMFGDGVVLDADELPGDYYCQSGSAAFSRLAEVYLEDTPLRATLREVLREESAFSMKLDGLDRVLENRDFHIDDPKLATALFGREMNISPTRVESFYQCRFRYFLEQGVRAFPLRRAELDPLETGTLIHKVLYVVAQKVDLKVEYDRALVLRLIQSELDDYIESVMGGGETKTKRFLYLYRRLCGSILKIVDQLHEELAQSDFTPCEFEYEITKDSDILPLRLAGEDGVVVNVAGKIDRVDSYTAGSGEKYIRIVDYKSGKKVFKLNDVLYGLNLQMLIYLQCISQGGRGEYERCLPAGILYMPAGEQPATLPREASGEEIEEQKRRAYRMNGLLLEDREVLQAMDSSMSGLFIPVALKKDESFTAASKGSLVTLSELGRINGYIDHLIVNMARELHAGRVEAVPLPDVCSYCDYRGVCGVTKASKVREYVSHTREEIIHTMEEVADNG